MPVTVTTNPSSQVTNGITMMAPPNNLYPEGIRATSVPTVPTPTLPPTTSLTNLTVGQWMMDPSGDFVLILDSNGLTLYRVVTGNPTSGSFQGVAVFGPVGKGGSYFCAQADGNAVVYDSTFPKSLTPTWAANSGQSGSAQYLFVQENGCFVTIQSHGVWGTPL